MDEDLVIERISRIAIADAPIFSTLDRDITSRARHLQAFLPPLLSIESLKEQITQKKASYKHRDVLFKLVSEQYKGVDCPPVLAKNIASLANETTFCVVTAHQPLLFGGKGYFLYKALTAINLSQWASQVLDDTHIVPVFVLGSEDHDFEEVRRMTCFQDTLEWESGMQGPVGQMPLGNIPELIEALESLLDGLPFKDEAISLLKGSYTPGTSFGRATFMFLHKLLGEKGLIVFDPDHLEAKRTFIPVLKQEIQSRITREKVSPVIDALEKVGVKHQAFGRDINLFYLSPGQRSRIDQVAPNQYVALDTAHSWTEEELLDAITEHPDRFSPNVLLRPLFQQTILPGVIFTGGAGELAYWMELSLLFKELDVPMPILARRDSVWLIDEYTQHRLDRLKLDISDFMQPQDELVRRFMQERHDFNAGLDVQKVSISKVLEEIRDLCGQIDPTLIRSMEATETNIMKQLEVLETKMIRGLKHLHEQEVLQIKNIYGKLFPEGVLQERQDSFIPWIARYGVDWIGEILEILDPLQPNLIIKRF